MKKNYNLARLAYGAKDEFKNEKQMKKLVFFLLSFWSIIQVPVHAQDDVNLFNYWSFYSDVENSTYKTSSSLAFKQLNKRKTAIAQLHTKDDYLKRQEVVKKKILQLLGPLPKKTPLNARITGVIKKKDYRVEKVIFESVPGYYVTAALFLPKKRKGKAPAIIYASGHTESGFRHETYQHIIINLVKKGFVVLAFDPVGQGERLQYYNKKKGKPDFTEPTIEHSYPGAQCYISGYSPTKYFVWDAMRSVDYLLSRNEVDPQRIGMTGRSGGGTQTAFAAAVDDRILAAAPECFITNMEYIFKTIGPQDAEQNLIHMISEGLDHADLLEVRAPKPSLMITTTSDFFSIQGARETYQEVKQFYKGLGGEEYVNMVEDDDVHTSTKKNREAMYIFFQKYLSNPGSSVDIDVEILEEHELWATKTGQLATSLKGETLFSLNKIVVENQILKLKLDRKKDTHTASVINHAKKISGFEYPKDYGDAIFSGCEIKSDYQIEKYLVQGSGDYVLPVALFSPIKNQKNEVVILLDEQGMEHAANGENSLVHSMLKQGYSVLLLDVAGIGSLGPGYLKGDAYVDNTSFNQWFAGILTHKSIVAIRVEDIIRITHFIKTDLRKIKIVSALAIGSVGSEMLHSAVFDATIQKVGLVQPFLSFADIALSRKYSAPFIPFTVAGSIEKYDLVDLMAAFCPNKILIVNPLSSNGKPMNRVNELTYPKHVFTQKGVEGNFRYIIEKENSLVKEHIIKWLN